MLLSIPMDLTYGGVCTCYKKILNSILMPGSICTQKEFLIESNLMDFGGFCCYSWT